jgi:hypothetical protein
VECRDFNEHIYKSTLAELTFESVLDCEARSAFCISKKSLTLRRAIVWVWRTCQTYNKRILDIDKFSLNSRRRAEDRNYSIAVKRFFELQAEEASLSVRTLATNGPHNYIPASKQIRPLLQVGAQQLAGIGAEAVKRELCESKGAARPGLPLT